jgi:peptidoglycan/xylan/chitin deacetylase (PgdA/CDA1 family)
VLLLAVVAALAPGCSSGDSSSVPSGSVTATTAMPTTAPTTTAAPTTVPVTTTQTPTTTVVPTTTVAPTTTVPPTTLPPTTVPATSIAPPASAAPAVRIAKGNPDRATVALTFDAGSDRGYTELILDTLKAEHIRASFGMTGKWAEANPDLLLRMVGEGHQLINHTYSHLSTTGLSTSKGPLSRDQRIAEVTKAAGIITSITGQSPAPWYRPPYGDIDKNMDALLGELGYHYTAMWTVDSLGWQGHSVDEITARCMNGATNGVIYLFHVGSASQDGPALAGIIGRLRAKGLTPGSMLDVL